MEQQLPELPSEVVLNILSFNPNYVAQASQISSEIRSLTATDYLKTLCRNDITMTEIQNYFETTPAIFGTFRVSANKSGVNIGANQEVNADELIFHAHYYKANPLQQKYDTYFAGRAWNFVGDQITKRTMFRYGSSNQVPPDVTISSIITRNSKVEDRLTEELAFLPDIEIDFLSQFRIYQRRVGCMSRDPGYARTKILIALSVLVKTSEVNMVYLANVYVRLATEMAIVGKARDKLTLGAITFYNFSTTYPDIGVTRTKALRAQIINWAEQLKQYYRYLP